MADRGRTTIEAPRPRPPVYSLVAVAASLDLVSVDEQGRPGSPPPPAAEIESPLQGTPNIRDMNPDRWVMGWQFVPYPCLGGGRLPINCPGDTGEMVPDPNPGIVVGDPFIVWSGDQCSTFGWEYRKFIDRAQSMMESTQSYEVANELWTGEFTAGVNGLENIALNDLSADVMTTAPAAIDSALACIEQGLADRLRGRRGMIHVTPQLLSLLVANGKLRREGNLWLSPMDSVVVADAGYDGTGPGGTPPTTSQWMYGTSLIGVVLGPVDVWPGPDQLDAVLRMALDRGVNKITYYATRAAGFVWDHCGHVAAEVNVAPCDQDTHAPGS